MSPQGVEEEQEVPLLEAVEVVHLSVVLTEEGEELRYLVVEVVQHHLSDSVWPFLASTSEDFPGAVCTKVAVDAGRNRNREICWTEQSGNLQITSVFHFKSSNTYSLSGAIF